MVDSTGTGRLPAVKTRGRSRLVDLLLPALVLAAAVHTGAAGDPAADNNAALADLLRERLAAGGLPGAEVTIDGHGDAARRVLIELRVPGAGAVGPEETQWPQVLTIIRQAVGTLTRDGFGFRACTIRVVDRADADLLFWLSVDLQEGHSHCWADPSLLPPGPMPRAVYEAIIWSDG